MERYLTRKATPHVLVVLVEVVLFTALAFWSVGSAAVFVQQYVMQMDWAVAVAFVILLVLPVMVCWWIIRRWLMRGKAMRVASALMWETTDQVSWELFEQHADVRSVRDTVKKLWEKKYLRNITLDYDGLQLCREDNPAQGVPNGGKCAMCGAQLEQRTSGDWACRYCGTVAGKN